MPGCIQPNQVPPPREGPTTFMDWTDVEVIRVMQDNLNTHRPGPLYK